MMVSTLEMVSNISLIQSETIHCRKLYHNCTAGKETTKALQPLLAFDRAKGCVDTFLYTSFAAMAVKIILVNENVNEKNNL